MNTNANIPNLDVMDIQNYSYDDLKAFLKIESNTITKDDVMKNADDLIEKLILQNKDSDVNEKKDMLNFINKARDRLIQSLNVPFENQITVIKKPNFNNFSEPSYSTEPHFVQNTHSRYNDYPNQIQIHYRTQMMVFNTLYCDEFLYESSPQTLKGDSTGAIDYTFTLINPIKNVMGLSLAALQYPNVQPTFSVEKNNVYMYITVDTGIQGVVQMDAGYYTSIDFPLILEKNINEALYGFGTYIPPQTNSSGQTLLPNFQNPFSVSISPYSNRLTIINTQNSNFKMIFDMPVWDEGNVFYNSVNKTFTTNVCAPKYPYDADLPTYYKNNKLQPNSLGFQIGYRNIIYDVPGQDIQPNYYNLNPDGSPTYSEVKSYTAEAQYEDGNGGYVYFCLDEFATNNMDSVTGVFPKFFFNNNVLALIPVTSPHFTNTLTTGADFIFKARNYTGPIDVSKIVVSFYDFNGIKITFNQVPFSFVIELKVLHDNPATIEKIHPRYNGSTG